MTTRQSTSPTVASSGLNLSSFFINSRTSPPTSNRWDKIRYLNLNRHLRNLYKAPRNFQKQAAQADDRVPPVSVPPVNGRPC